MLQTIQITLTHSQTHCIISLLGSLHQTILTSWCLHSLKSR